MEATRPILYSTFRSSCSWRVRLALQLKGVYFEYRDAQDPKNWAELKELNPAGMIPVFVSGDTVLTESLAIVEYIDEVFPQEPRLLPNDPVKRAKARAIALQPLQNRRVVSKVEELAPGKGEEWAHHWVKEGLEILEKILQSSGGKSVPLKILKSLQAHVRGVDVTPYTTLTRVNSSLSELEAFKAADEAHQPDSPKQ